MSQNECKIYYDLYYVYIKTDCINKSRLEQKLDIFEDT